jgi:hypothetical protein
VNPRANAFSNEDAEKKSRKNAADSRPTPEPPLWVDNDRMRGLGCVTAKVILFRNIALSYLIQ